jgi:hypothetical protein
MATKQECALCNPDIGGDSLCDDCIDKAAGYDSLKSRLYLIMAALRRSRDACRKRAQATADELEHTLQRTHADVLDIFLYGYFQPELAEDCERTRREAEFKRQVDAAALKKVG